MGLLMTRLGRDCMVGPVSLTWVVTLSRPSKTALPSRPEPSSNCTVAIKSGGKGVNSDCQSPLQARNNET
ncbi:hypothetical protein HanXRQr2_Chr15g0711001 [Helianthus annuus]|uniref:Uncharacterized protein n=1 Tax=Helianthus annuus TaxID=4232 RepID=A0A9K3E358_HELAN|nr:hypothetical protein HanXRQr2_Chr15g0711001 [Helianthus annuus]KAJ0923992.1 hypothetical protein HanPSC8_Chr05g0223101 [Helianthus annuus]